MYTIYLKPQKTGDGSLHTTNKVKLSLFGKNLYFSIMDKNFHKTQNWFYEYIFSWANERIMGAQHKILRKWIMQHNIILKKLYKPLKDR